MEIDREGGILRRNTSFLLGELLSNQKWMSSVFVWLYFFLKYVKASFINNNSIYLFVSRFLLLLYSLFDISNIESTVHSWNRLFVRLFSQWLHFLCKLSCAAFIIALWYFVVFFFSLVICTLICIHQIQLKINLIQFLLSFYLPNGCFV